MTNLGGFAIGDWRWEEEIAEIHRQKQKEYNEALAKKEIVYILEGKVYIERHYFSELAKQLKHKVSIALESFPHTDTHFYISQLGYERLIKYLPLPPWGDLKIHKR